MNESWFAVTPIDGETFAISEPLHWEEPHSYLLCGESRALLIDTGLGVADMGAVVRSLTSLPVLAAVTHAHWDHIGGLGCFEHTAVHHAEASWLSGHFPLPSQAVRANLTARPCTFPHGFCPDDYRVYEGGVDHLLKDGDVIDLGNRQVRVIHTPGHSPGHCCFYEEARGLLFAGGPALCRVSGCLLPHHRSRGVCPLGPEGEAASGTAHPARASPAGTAARLCRPGGLCLAKLGWPGPFAAGERHI